MTADRAASGRPAGQPAAGPAAEAPKPPAIWHITFHLVTPKGIPVELERDIVGADLIGWLRTTEENLEKAGFKPLTPPAIAGITAATAPAEDDSWIPKFCPDCAQPRAEFFDNRSDPNRPSNGPDLKCSNKDCGKGFWKNPPRRPVRR